MAPVEREGLHLEPVKIGGDLRHARSERAVEQAFNRYIPNPIDYARATRITTLAADALTTQPVWVIDHVRYLYGNQQLAATEPAELATRIIAAAAHLDIHGDLPTNSPTPPPLVDELGPTGVEVG